MTRPNGITTNYSYDNLSRLLSVLHQSGSTTLDGASYTVDNAGNRTSKTDQYANVTSNYAAACPERSRRNPIYELTQVTQATTTTESYTYDAVGNRLSSLGVSPYSVNVSNELTSTPSTTYTYDNNGNTVTKVDSTGTTTYAWDFENRLTSVTLPGSGGTVSFAYDPFGRRIKKVTSTTTSVFAYDGDNLVEETNSSGAVVARYEDTQNIDEPLAMLRNRATSYFHADGLGSITSLSSAAGSIVNTYSYDSFGNLTASTGYLVNPFQYTARESDSETGLYYYRARYYDPSVGRFLTEDPIRFTGSFDFYSYVGNSPIDLADPLGLFGTRDGITRHRSVDIDPSCGIRSGGACTLFRAALVLCTCTNTGGCDDKWKANAELRIYGDMYVYSGPFPYKGRKPKDPSVHDAASAIAHEYNAHINPAISAVTPLINALEAKTFKSKEECQSECDITSGAVNKLFRQTLKQTQDAENNQ